MRNVRHEIPVSPEWPAALEQFRARWRMIAVACGVAAVLSLTASVLMARKYTAYCRVLVDAPAGSDPRVSTAVSPIYLESLRTYEMFAGSDDLFQQAARKFGLRTDASPIEKLKKKVLKVEVLRNTKILEISATLGDPVKAHELALYIGQEAVNLSRTVGRTADQELMQGAQSQLTESQKVMERAQRAWTDAAIQGPVDQLNAELQADVELRSRLQRQLAESEVDLAEAESAPERVVQVKAARARVEQARSQVKALEQAIAREQALTAERTARMQKLETERKAAEAALKTAESRVNDIRSSAGYRGERLNIIDPGITPERPSSPNVALNVLAAVFAALVLSVLYVLLQISYRSQPSNRYE